VKCNKKEHSLIVTIKPISLRAEERKIRKKEIHSKPIQRMFIIRFGVTN